MPRAKVIAAFLSTLFVGSVVLAAPVTIMPIGDSITAGFNSVDSEGGYRPYLYDLLASQGVQIQYQGIVADTGSAELNALGQDYYTGQSGFDTGAIRGNLDGSVHALNSGNSNLGGYWMTGGNGTGRPSYNPNIVILLSGANDYSGASETEAGMAGILSWFATNRPTTQVIMASTPPEDGYGPVPYQNSQAVNAWLQSYIPANYPQDRAADVFDAFLNSDGSINDNLIPLQSVHPNQAGYQVIANVFDAAVISSLTGPSVPEPNCMVLLIAGPLLIMRRRIILPQQPRSCGTVAWARVGVFTIRK